MIHPRRIDMNLLELLVQIHDTRSVSAAGRNLGLSQPATSNALSRLRESLGDRLFLRGSNGMEPTPFIERIVPEIRAHLSGIATVLNEGATFDAANSRRTFRLSLSGLGEQVFMAPLADRVLASAPNVRLENISSPFTDLSRTLALQEAEMAIGLVEISDPQLRQMHLYDEVYRVVGPPGLSPARARGIDLRRERLVMAVPSATYADDLERILREKDLVDAVRVRIRNFGALPELLARLDAFTIVPDFFGRKLADAGQVTLMDITLPRGRQKVQLVWHANTTEDPGCIWLRDIIRETFMDPRIVAEEVARSAPLPTPSLLP